MSDEKREWFAMNMSTNEIYDYAQGLKHRLGLWKRAAKNWREAWYELQEALKVTCGKLREAEATATRRKELLRRVEWKYDHQIKMYVCLFCGSTALTLEWAGIIHKHVKDCDLAKELRDSRLARELE